MPARNSHIPPMTLPLNSLEDAHRMGFNYRIADPPADLHRDLR